MGCYVCEEAKKNRNAELNKAIDDAQKEANETLNWMAVYRAAPNVYEYTAYEKSHGLDVVNIITSFR